MTTSRVLVLMLCFVLGQTFPHWLSAQEMVSDEESEAAEHMHDHLTYITTIKALIIMGRLERIRQPAH